MLELLRVANYAIIDELEIEFLRGLTAITGETGAGKSILIGALKLALGERASADVIRTGAQRCSVEALWSVVAPDTRAWLEQSGLALADEPGRVIVRREVLAGGGSRNYINNCSVTAAQLRDLADRLIDLHGQNEHTSLLDASVQLRLLDAFGGHAAELERYRSAYRAHHQAARALETLQNTSGDAERRKSFLEFQIDEIMRAELVAGEDEQLAVERKRLQNAERLRQACAAAADVLYDGENTENPAATLAGSAAHSLAEVADADPEIARLAEDAQNLRYTIEEVAGRARTYADSISADPQRLQAVEDRLDLIRTLKRKYGATIEEILAACEGMRGELCAIENHDAAVTAAGQALSAAAAQLVSAAGELSLVRAGAAGKFEQRVQAEMRRLELPRAVFRVAFERPGADVLSFAPEGAEQADYLVLLNPGEEPRPLRKVASGGEISRIMLAIEVVLARKLEIPTLVFDEIDVGISGDAATRVAQKLREIAGTRQVICITHLPQVAAQGEQHLVVEKAASKTRTSVAVRAVTGAERASAIAEMLAGREADASARKYAERLLQRE